MKDFCPQVSSQSDARWQRALARLEGAYAPTTLRSFERHFRQFAKWCRSRQCDCLPADPDEVAAFIEHRSTTLKPPSLMQLVKSIGRVHALAGEADPTQNTEVFLALRRAVRRNAYRPHQAFGLTTDALTTMSLSCPETLEGLRDRALLWVGFETLCRGSELAGLRVDDLTASKRRAVVATIRKSKTDQVGRGRTVVLSATATGALHQWLSRSEITAGYLFQPIVRGHLSGEKLSVSRITRILRARAAASGFPASLVRQISSHSLRVGGAQQLTMNNHNLAQIMRAGGWKSVGSVSRYIEAAELSVWDSPGTAIVLPIDPPGRHHRTKGWS